MGDWNYEWWAGFSSDLVESFCHSLWQGVIVAAVVWGALRVVPSRGGNLRYLCALSGLLLLSIALPVTFGSIRQSRLHHATHSVSSDSIPPDATTEQSIEANPAASTKIPDDVGSLSPSATTPNLPSETSKPLYQSLQQPLAAGWLLISIVMLVRAAVAHVMVRQWLRRADEDDHALTDLDPIVAEVSDSISRLLGRNSSDTPGIPLRCVQCQYVTSPSVFGILAPVILVPPAMATGVSVEQWRIILAHEIAHIRRYDGLVNMIQIVLESLLFFNPALWWLSRQVRTERESCCDQLAASVSGSRRGVAQALLDVAESRQQVALPVLAFGGGRLSSLGQRVVRLLHPERAAGPQISLSGAVGTLMLVLLASLSMQQATQVAVVAAAQILSDNERVGKLGELRTRNTGSPVPATKTVNADTKVPIRFRITTADGAPVPASTVMHCVHNNGANRTNIGALESIARSAVFLDNPAAASRMRLKPETGDLKFKLPIGKVWIGVVAPGYAPAFVQQTIAGHEKEVQIAVNLKQAPAGRIRLIGDDGTAIAGATMTATILLPKTIAGDVDVTSISVKTGQDGVAVLPHCSTVSVRLNVQHSGYQPASKPITLSKDIATWALARGFATEVMVVSEKDSKPIESARIHHVTKDSSIYLRGRTLAVGGGRLPTDNWLVASSGEAVATTDEDGRARVRDLVEDSTTILAVAAEGFGTQIIKTAIRRDGVVRVSLKAPITIRGNIRGDLERLNGNRYHLPTTKPSLMYANEAPHVAVRSYVVVSPTGEFEIQDVLPGRIEFQFPFQRQSFTVTESREDIELQIPEAPMLRVPPPAAAGKNQREVIWQFTGVKADAPVKGFVTVMGPGYRRIPVRDNQVATRLPVGSNVSLNMSELVGYIGHEQTPTKIAPGSEPQRIDVPLRPAGAVHGEVQRPDGSDPKSLRVLLIPVKLPDGVSHRTNNSIKATTRGMNSYFHSAAIGGRYRLLVWNTDQDAGEMLLTDPFDVTAERPIIKMDLQFSNYTPATLKVTDADQRPAAGRTVKLSYAWPGVYWKPSATVQTDARGLATIRQLQLDGKGPSQLSIDVAPSDGLTGARREFSGSATEHRVVLQSAPNRSGRVTIDHSGEPIAGVYLSLLPEDESAVAYSFPRSTKTDVFGKFEFPGLEPALYKMRIIFSYPNGGSVTSINQSRVIDVSQPDALDIKVDLSK